MRIYIIKSSYYIDNCPKTIGETEENHFFDCLLIELTLWRIDIIKSSLINDCPTTIGETVEKYLCQERKVRYFKKHHNCSDPL